MPPIRLPGITFLLLLMPVFLAGQDVVEKLTIHGILYSFPLPSVNIQIITDEEIRELGVGDLSQLFQILESVNVSRRGSLDSSFDLSMRGGNFQQTLVLVNGIPFNNPQTGHFNTDLPFSLEDIQRIEVLKGGHSVYASGAFAGAINIILKQSEKLSFTLSGGENALFRSRVAAGGLAGSISSRISLEKRDTRGFYPGRELDALSFNAGLHYRKEASSADFFAGYQRKDFGAQGFYGPYPSREETGSGFFQGHFQQQLVGITLNLKTSLQWHTDHFLLDRTRPEIFQNHSYTREERVGFSMTFRPPSLRLVMGAEYRSQNMDSEAMGFHQRKIPALFANLSRQKTPRSPALDLGGRLEFYSDRPRFSFHGGFLWPLNPHLRLRGGISHTYRYPSFTELYYQSPVNSANPLLEPEKSLNLESALAWVSGRHTLQFTAFHRWHRNLIDWISTAKPLFWQAVNLPQNAIWGLEFTHRYQRERFAVHTILERILSPSEDLPPVSKYGLRFPDRQIRLNLRYRLARHLFLSGRYGYKGIFHTRQRGHFLDVILEYQLGEKWRVKLSGDNLLDTRIEEIPGVLTTGRWLYLSIHYHPPL